MKQSHLYRQNYSSNFVGALLTNSGKWKASLSPDAFEFFRQKEGDLSISYALIETIEYEEGRIWATINIGSKNGSIQIRGIRNREAKHLVSRLKMRVGDALFSSFEIHKPALTRLAQSFDAFRNRSKGYLAQNDIQEWLASNRNECGESCRTALMLVGKPLFPARRLNEEIPNLGHLMKVIRGDVAGIQTVNEAAIAREKTEFKSFFDSVEKTPLTDEQRRACIVMEDRNLLIAAAGSGKTSTLVGKVGYALLRQYVRPEQVLVLAFNNHATRELEQRIKDRLKDIPGSDKIQVKTFHSLGLEIIAEVENRKPTVADFAADQSGGKRLIGDLVQTLLQTDTMFVADWILFNALYPKPIEDPATFDSLDDWQSYIKDTGDYRTGRNGFQTMNGEMVKSQGELAIANWLFLNGVNYQYEKPYQYDTADQQHRQYHPDFFFPELNLYLEHYALDAKGHPPQAFGEKYLQSMEWKRALHQEKGTAVIETFFADFVQGTLFAKLETELVKRGAKLRQRSSTEVLARINELQSLEAVELGGLIQTFIKHAKSNQTTVGDLETSARTHRHPERAKLFVRIISRLLEQYTNILLEAGTVDFEDMIVKAGRYAFEGRYQHPYRLILVDEFQDISRARANLLLGLMEHVPSCKLFAVGDDWQSIYRFAGSDISLFTDFPRIFGPTAINYLTRTFRSNQGITDVASCFIQKNDLQVQKAVVAVDQAKSKVITIRKYAKLDDIPEHVLGCLQEMAEQANAAKVIRTVFFLGRYNHLRLSCLDELQKKFGGALKLDFKTIHGAKGLQADYVVVLGMQSGKTGFPSRIADDPLLELVMPVPEIYPHAEERRLFYVALTRARYAVYLLASQFAPSVFIKELETTPGLGQMLKNPSADILAASRRPVEICPRCGRGRLRPRKGKYGPFLGCSEYPACEFTRNNGRQ